MVVAAALSAQLCCPNMIVWNTLVLVQCPKGRVQTAACEEQMHVGALPLPMGEGCKNHKGDGILCAVCDTMNTGNTVLDLLGVWALSWVNVSDPERSISYFQQRADLCIQPVFLNLGSQETVLVEATFSVHLEMYASIPPEPPPANPDAADSLKTCQSVTGSSPAGQRGHHWASHWWSFV